MSQQEAEYMECKVNMRSLEKKVEEMTTQLCNAEEALAQMLRSSGHKDQLVREMTEQVNISESKLHAYQINEVLGMRQRQLEQRSRDGDVNDSVQQEKEPPGSHAKELVETPSKPSQFGRRGSNAELQGMPLGV